MGENIPQNEARALMELLICRASGVLLLVRALAQSPEALTLVPGGRLVVEDLDDGLEDAIDDASSWVEEQWEILENGPRNMGVAEMEELAHGEATQ